jgi:hypothetical protein
MSPNNSETPAAPPDGPLAFASETTVQASGALVEVGTVTYRGRPFAALGSVQDPTAGLILAYVRERAPDLYELTTWEGVAIAPLRLVRRWKQWGFGGVRNEIFAWSAEVFGRTYTGRNSGPVMIVRMRAGKTTAAR